MLSPSLEDYLEEIYRFSLTKSEVRVKDIAEKLKVSPPSVVKALRKLHYKSYIIYKKYEGIHLTEDGKKLGKLLVKRNGILKEFLFVIHSECDIEAEAEAMEHYLSSPTILSIEQFVEFMKKDVEVMKKFRLFCEESKERHWSEGIEK